MSFVLALGWIACDKSDGPPPDTGDGCVDAPVITWENWGAGFLLVNCQTCHATTSPDRHDAPEDVTFDTKEDALRLKGAILSMAASPEPLMPPEGGVSDDDRERLRIWLTCYAD